MKSYKELEVWQKSIGLTSEIYTITKSFPSEEKYTLVSQLRRSALSIPSNIAEGWGRGSTKEYIHFLLISRASLMELETQIIISSKLNYITKKQQDNLEEKIISISMMLNKLISKLRRKLD